MQQRPIKLRIWRPIEGAMMYLTSLVSTPDEPDFNKNGGLMQFTGLHDKNGKEIWEGDIISHDKTRGVVVVWNEEIAGWDVEFQDNYKTWGSLPDFFPGEIQIIGNIYENPELLKQ